MNPSLDNVFWRALNGAHAHLSVGHGGARRYAPGLSPLAAFEDPTRPDFDALWAHCVPGESLYLEGWRGDAPPGWRITAEAALCCMAWQGGAPPARDVACSDLGPPHREQVLDLVARTHPGPFGARTMDMGDYVGCFDGERLVAMAGERLFADGLREISGVCTDPAYRGRGLARGLMNVLIVRQLARGELPFLHVVHRNVGARRLYEQMGFRTHHVGLIRVVTACVEAADAMRPD